MWPVYSLALAYQVTSAVWRLAGRLPSRLLQYTWAQEEHLADPVGIWTPYGTAKCASE
jgi:hypothetical protein